MAIRQTFRISSALKDVIGRDLITNEFVAIFELVKNSFDAHANWVSIEFDEDKISIIDDGKGMSQADIQEKWLFVAYSAKRTGTEDDSLPDDYRDLISVRRGYAGNKGIGRFSCDRLGARLDLYSRKVHTNTIEHLEVDWTSFEADSKQEFGTIIVHLGQETQFPALVKSPVPTSNGTVLVISKLRQLWGQEKIDSLRAYLAKLVDPFGTTRQAEILTFVANHSWPNVEGQVGNDIADILSRKTTRIEVVIEGDVITSSLYDRSVQIYKTEEDNPFELLKKSRIEANVYYLNRSAKATFTRQMGIQPVSFGSVFLFVNGFRIFPIGEPTDDTFGIGRRKQQGTARYFGNRDIIGKVDVHAPPRMFQEASSRDAGLIEDETTEELFDAVRRYVIFRLERYVTNVNWPDKLDMDRDDASGLRSDSGKARVIRVIRMLVGSKNIRLLDYDRDLVDVVSERAAQFEETMGGLVAIAEREGDKELLARIERSRARFTELKIAEEEARAAAERETNARIEAERRANLAERRADRSDQLVERLEKQAKLLLNSQDKGDEQLMLFHHQAIIYATEVESLVRTSLSKLSGACLGLDELNSKDSENTLSSIIDLTRNKITDALANLQSISLQNSRILAVTRFATQANFKLEADRITADIVQFLGEYVREVSSTYEDADFVKFKDNELAMISTFRPIDISIVVDNLISNASKARATRITFTCRKVKGGSGVEVVVEDDGNGIDDRVVDVSKIFDKGYTGSSRGSGLGLYHARLVLEEMGGGLGLDPDRPPRTARFIIRLPQKDGKS
ncbi:ATP-binding protein [Neorhizobium petrolearium]|uniref:ATP-binding protein n=1 Tax=Neorhizobium petrolearium TaxID=515361 RepID=UPI003F8072BC